MRMWSSFKAGFASLRKRFSANVESSSVISRRGFFAVALLVVVGTLVTVHPSYASGIEDFVAQAVGNVVQLLLFLVGNLLLIMIGALVWVAQYNGFVNSVPVLQGWSIVRDITNMFFIVIMLIYAFGTILGVEAYSYKKGLVNLMIMAIVVNFSRTICGLLIDASQVVMLTFVYGFKEAAGGNFADALGITKIMQMKESGDTSVTALTVTISLLLGLVMTGIALMVVVIMTISLAIRIVILWLLIVLSPLAFLTRAVPGSVGKGQYAKWWKMFTSQLIFGPIMAFFLWLSLVSVASPDFTKTGPDGFPSAAAAGANSEAQLGGVSQAFQDTNIEQFIIAICLLVGGLQMAKEVADNMSVLGKAGDMAKGAYGRAKSAYQGGKAAVVGGAKAAGAVGGAGIGLADMASGGRATTAKNWALTQAGKVPFVGGAAEAKLARDKAANQDIAKKAKGRAEVANEEIVKSRSGEKALTMDGQIERNEYQKKRVQDLANKSKKESLNEAERREYFSLSKSIKKHGKKFGDSSGDDVLSKIEKKNPALIIDANEKDPKERKRQEDAFTKAARATSKQDLADMDPAALTPQLLANLSAKQVMEAQKIATGDNLEKLEKMGSNEAEIKQYQENLRGRADVFGVTSESERAKRVGGMNADELRELASDPSVRAEHLDGAVLSAIVANGNAGAIADKIAPTLDAKTLSGDEALAGQIASGISASALAALPNEIGAILRPLVANGSGESDKNRALLGGASMEQAFKGYGKDGNFDAPENLAGFEKYLQEGLTAKRAGSVPAEAIAKNGGLNDVAITMINNITGGNLQSMAKDGKTSQVSEVIAAAAKLAAVDTNDQAAVDKFITGNPGITSTEKELRAAMTNAALLVADTSGASNPIRAAAQEKNMWKEAQAEIRKEGQEARAREGRQRASDKMTRKLLKKNKGTSRSK